MRSVLGIDAAWTLKNPSGVALVVENMGGWRLDRLASSYSQFLNKVGSEETHSPDVESLLQACQRITGAKPTLVAVDMPLSLDVISGRRTSDNEVSAAYGARYASTHSPSAVRPGVIGDTLRADFASFDYELATALPVTDGLVEVYPHPALIELCHAERRLPYKESKVRKYWPELSMQERRIRLIDEWSKILAQLDLKIAGVTLEFSKVPTPNSRAQFKAFEDRLDAVVCAWVGTSVLQGKAVPYGDSRSAIWIPQAD